MTGERQVKITPASEILPKPAPWTHYPHCPHCERRLVQETTSLPPGGSRAPRLLPFDGITCPYCRGLVQI